MPSIHETAYPRLKASIPKKDLEDLYTPTIDEIALAATHARGGKGKVYFLVQLKTFQRLGYFTLIRDVPKRIITFISEYLATELQPGDFEKYDISGSRQRHVAIIREHHGVQAADDGGKSLLGSVMREAASTKDDLADIINVGIEELIRHRFELPGFTGLVKAARRCRASVNKEFHEQIAGKLDRNGRARIDNILQKDESSRHTPWQALKLDPGKPTLNHLRELVEHLQWLQSMSMQPQMFENIPDAKLRHFAAEAKSLDAAGMREMEANKRYALCAALIKMQSARRLDDLALMFIKRMKRIHNKAQEALDAYRKEHQGRVDKLLSILQELLTVLEQPGTSDEKLATMKSIVGERQQELIEECKAYAAYADNSYAPFLWKYYKSYRQTFFRTLWVNSSRIVAAYRR